jgi:hypothetical protein
MRKINIFRKKNIINYIVAGLSFLSSYFVYKASYSINGYHLYFLIPFIFGVLNCLLLNICYSDISKVGVFIFNISMIIKYTISPLIGSVSAYYSLFGVRPTSSELSQAIKYIIYEMIVLCLLNNYLSKKYNKKEKLYKNTPKPIRSGSIYFIVIIIGIVTVILLPQVVMDYRFIFNTENLETTIMAEFPLVGLFRLLVYFARYSTLILIINYFYKKNLIKESYINVIIPIIAIFINSLYTSNLSRIGFFIPIVSFTMLLFYIYDSPKVRKLIIRLLTVAFSSGMLLLSWIKFFGEGRGDAKNSVNISWWGDILNMYFTGAKETAIGIKAISLINNTYGWNKIGLIFNDCFSNVILISNFTDSTINSTSLYNYTYFGSKISVSQIVPNICEGIYYFGGVFSPIWLCVFVYLTYYFSDKIFLQQYFDTVFVYVYASIYCGMVLMINSSMIIANIINLSLLFAIVSIINKKILFKYKKYK